MTISTTGQIFDTRTTDGKYVVSDSAVGTLTVDAGSVLTVQVPPSATAGEESRLVLGRAATGNGTVTITGAGSRVDVLSGGNAGGHGALVDVGRLGTGTIRVESGGLLHLKNDGTAAGQSAFMQLGASGGTSSVVVDGAGSVLRLTSATSGTINMGHVFDAAAPGQVLAGSAGSQSSLIVSSGGRLEMIDGSGQNSLNLGRGAGQASMTIQSGGIVNLDVGDATGGAVVGVGSGVNLQAATLTVTGAGSRLEGVDTLTVGKSPFGGPSVGGNGTVVVSNGGAIVVRGDLAVGEGGSVSGDGGTITTGLSNSLFVSGLGTLGDTDGLIQSLTIKGSLNLNALANWVIDINATTADRWATSLLENENSLQVAGDVSIRSVKANLKVAGGFQFAAGDTRVFIYKDSPKPFFTGSARLFDSISITGQHADFSYFIGEILELQNSTIGLLALNSGATGGTGTLDFGATWTVAGNFTSGAAFANVTGGRYGAIGGSAVGVDKVQGTAAGDRFDASSLTSGPIMLEGRDGDDQLTGGGGGDTLVGGKGNDRHTGGGGTDLVVFTGPASEYTFSFNGSGQLVVTDTVADRDGIDTIVSGVENLSFNSVTMARPVGVVTITSGPASPAEGSSGPTPLAYTVTRTGDTSGAASVNWAVVAGTAIAGDFVGGVLPSGTVGFAAGETTKVITINVIGDSNFEPDETFSVVLSGPSAGLAIGAALPPTTITNDDVLAAPDLAIAALSADKLEENSGATAYTFIVTRSGDTSGTSSASWAVSGAAVTGADFSGGALPSGTVSFAAGEASKNITVNVAGDTTVEGDEAFSVTLSAPTNATLGTATAAATIRNDDVATAPSLAIAALSADKLEENSGTTAYTFTVTRSGDTSGESSANWAVSGAAVSGADFIGGALPSGTVSFAAGETSKTISVNVQGDTTVEGDEAFTVTLSTPTNATLGTATAAATIRNDDVATAPSLAIAALSADKLEENSGTTAYTFTVTRSGDTSGESSANWAVSGAAVSGADFTGGALPSGTVSFAAGETSKTISVNVAGDTTVEGDEAFTVTLSTPTNATLGTATAVANIWNDDAVFSIRGSFSDRAEGSIGTSAFDFFVTRSGEISRTASVNYTVRSGAIDGATSGDFAIGVLPRGTLTFLPGVQLQIIALNILADRFVENDEFFEVYLDAPTLGGTIDPIKGQVIAVIRNDDTGISIAAASADKAEGNSGATAYTFTVTRSGDTSVASAADWAVSGAAVTGADFVGGALPSGTVSFAAGETSKTVTVDVAGDTTVEGNEAFDVRLSAPTNAVLGTSTANGVIRNDDATISIAADSANKLESNDGTTQFTFTVTRSGDTSSASSANWAVSGTAVNGADFTGGALPSGTVSFAAGETSKTIAIDVRGDTTVEGDEAFSVTLSAPTNATLGTATAAATIRNDDATLAIVSLAADKAEGNAGATAYTFTVTRSGDTSGASSANWAVSGAAVTGADFSGGALPSGTVSFAAGETSKTISVSVRGDTTVESDEAFTVTLSAPTNATLGTATAAATIRNDDATLAIVSLAANKAEGNAGATDYTFTVTRSGDTSGASSASWAVSGAAVTGADFSGGALPSGTVSFAAGETSKTISVSVQGDTTVEGDEAFTVTLSTPTNATLGTATAAATIRNDDTTLAIAALLADKAEGNAGATAYTFIVTRSGDTSGESSANWAVSGAAVTAADFSGAVVPSGSVSFAAGETSKTITVNVAGDTTVEGDEAFNITLSALTNASLGTGTATGTIRNDDIIVSIAALSADKAEGSFGDEGNFGLTPYTFTLTRAGDPTRAFTVDWGVVSMGTGLDELDFSSIYAGLPSGTLGFAAGETSRTLTINVASDTEFERDEGFRVNLTRPSAGVEISSTAGSASGTIRNDDVELGGTIIIEDKRLTEGDSDSREITFTVRRTGGVAPFTVDYATLDGSATAGSDYTATTGTLAFAAGELSRTIAVTTLGDTRREANETFTVRLSNATTRVIIDDAEGLGTLIDNDRNNLPAVSARNVTLSHDNLNPLLSSMLSVNDLDGDAITGWEVLDNTQGQGSIAVNGAALPQAVTSLTPAEFATARFSAFRGSTDSVWVRASDGMGFSQYVNFTVSGAVNNAPVLTSDNGKLTRGNLNPLLTSLFSATDADGDAITRWQFWDNTGGPGRIVKGGVAQSELRIIDMTPAEFAAATFEAYSSPDSQYHSNTLLARAFDGFVWSGWIDLSVIGPQNAAPVVTAPNVSWSRGNTSPLLSTLVSATDADGDAITHWQFWDDTYGDNRIIKGGIAQSAFTVVSMTVAEFATATFEVGPGTERLSARAFDGYAWSAWNIFLVSPPANTAPTIIAPNVTLARGNTNPLLSSLFSASDAEGDAISRWQFWDHTSGAGSIIKSGVAQSVWTTIEMTAAEFATATYRAGTSWDQLYLRSFDGIDWSDWKNFYVIPFFNTAPVVVAPNVTLTRANTNPLLSSLVSATDANADAITGWEIYDNTGGAGSIIKGGVAQSDLTTIAMTAAEFATATYRAGAAWDQLVVRAFDGSGWSEWKSFYVSPFVNTAPVVAAPNTTLTRTNLNPLLSSLVSATDADGDTITQWQFLDRTGGAGNIVKGGIAQAALSTIDMTAAEFATATYQSAAPWDNLFARAFDGADWSAWKQFYVSSPVNTTPVITAPSTTLTRGNPNPLLSTLISTTDAEGDAISRWELWDNTSGAGNIIKGGVAQSAMSTIEMTAAEFATATYQSGGSWDHLIVRAFDGIGWSDWKNFYVSPPTNSRPVIDRASAWANARFAGDGESRALSNIFTDVRDKDGDAVVEWEFWDLTLGSGHFSKGAVIQPANTRITMTPAEFATASFTMGNTDERIFARVYDGFDWSNWVEVNFDNLMV